MARRIVGIIVAYKNSEQIRKLVAASLKTSITRLVIVNNDPSSKTELEQIVRGKSIDLINNGDNLGFAKAVNLGIVQGQKHNPTHFLLLNPDLTFTKAEAETLLTSNGDIVGPVLKFKRGDGIIYDYGGKINFLLGRPIHEESNKRIISNLPAVDFVSGACMLISWEVVNRIGMLDEKYFMYFEDVDYCLRAKKADFQIKVEGESVFNHDIEEHRFSLNKAKLSYTLKSNLYFINKWVPIYAKPFSYCYLLLLALKIRLAL